MLLFLFTSAAVPYSPNLLYPASTHYICYNVLSDPPGALVFKSHPSQQVKSYIGITPLTFQCFSTETIPEGNSTLYVTKPGFEEWTMEIDLRGYYSDSIKGAQNAPVIIQAVLKPINQKNTR